MTISINFGGTCPTQRGKHLHLISRPANGNWFVRGLRPRKKWEEGKDKTQSWKSQLLHIPTLTLQVRTFFHHVSIRKGMSYARKRHCSLNLLEISVLPIRKVKIGNTLETRGLTHSYTFCKNPKNALTGCKGTNESANTQTFFRLFSLFTVFRLPTKHKCRSW